MSKVAPPVRTGKASLFLTIDSQPYSIRQARPDGFIRAFRLSKVHATPKRYVAGKTKSGRLDCTCPDFWRHGGNDGFACKHLLALIAVGLLSRRKPRPSESAGRRILKGLSLGKGVAL